MFSVFSNFQFNKIVTVLVNSCFLCNNHVWNKCDILSLSYPRQPMQPNERLFKVQSDGRVHIYEQPTKTLFTPAILLDSDVGRRVWRSVEVVEAIQRAALQII